MNAVAANGVMAGVKFIMGVGAAEGGKWKGSMLYL
jgi:hypothetical protein